MPAPRADVNEGDPLSPREQEVWDLRRQGYTYLNIASILAIKVDTVRTHIATVLRKTGCASSLELANREKTHYATEKLHAQIAELNETINLLSARIRLLTGAV
jgi:DNA-binding CsgD family transcriptional regulator